ncbi:GDP-mannose transporter GONST3 [Vitis vinifera]|uniref:GDP-mannose transporter GONST3 n=1 Tax=Vitis vinifera TaxID=29760 RepID=A0A438I9Q2_VITVI|nr:GDP-mannose transporter GONST3 [Vitis vinifera]
MSIDEENPKAVEPRKGSETLSSSTQNPATCCKALLRRASIYGVALGYCISASLLSIINKWAVMRFPYPGALTALQYFTSVAGVLIGGWLKLIDHGGLHGHTLWRFFRLQSRSTSPSSPTVSSSSTPTLTRSSCWGVAYLVSMSIDFVYIKHVVMNIGLKTWGLVLYNNLEALVLFPLELLVMGELEKPRLRPWTRVMPRRRLERWAVREFGALGLALGDGFGLELEPNPSLMMWVASSQIRDLQLSLDVVCMRRADGEGQRDADRASGQRHHAADEKNRKASRDLPRKMETGICKKWWGRRRRNRGGGSVRSNYFCSREHSGYGSIEYQPEGKVLGLYSRNPLVGPFSIKVTPHYRQPSALSITPLLIFILIPLIFHHSHTNETPCTQLHFQPNVWLSGTSNRVGRLPRNSTLLGSGTEHACSRATIEAPSLSPLLMAGGKLTD